MKIAGFLHILSDAASGRAGQALAHPEFGSSVNPITTRGADYAQRITASPPGFENLAAALPLDPPVGGAQKCEDWGPGGSFKVCRIECDEGLKFSREVPEYYICGAFGVLT